MIPDILVIIVTALVYIWSLGSTLYILIGLDLYDEFSIFDYVIESVEEQIILMRAYK